MMHSPPIRKILFLAANPKDTGRLRLDEEVRDIQEGLKLSPGRDNIRFHAQWATRIQDLRRSLLEHAPHIVHFSGHGVGTQGLVLEDEAGYTHCIQAETLARLFKLCPSVQCVLLNACYSQVQAVAIAQFVPYVIGMNQAIDDEAAIKFAVGFYDALGYGRSLVEAYEFGMTAIEVEPSVIQRDGVAHLEVGFPAIPAPATPVLILSEGLSKSVKPPTPRSRKAYRDRQAILNKVKNYWIKGVLERSLHNQILIELGLEERLDFADPFNMALGMVHQPQQSLAPGTQAIEVFDALGEGRSLLILGEPGSGKTITLLQLTRDLAARAEQDVNHLIPVVFNLSSWEKGQTLDDWLVEELNTKYQAPKPIAEPWVKQQQLLLMLDGLDEVQAGDREACVEAINQFQQAHGTEMVVCSRIKDYEGLQKQLTCQGAIYLKPLTLDQIQHYLDRLGIQSTYLRQLLTSDTALQELAQSPLMLNLMVLAYGGLKRVDLPKTNVIEDYRKQLFNVYITRMLARRSGLKQYADAPVMRWLHWLAQSMIAQSKTVFLIERLDRSWLQKKYQRWVYLLLSLIIKGILYALIFGLSITLDYGLFKGLQIGMIAGLFGAIVHTPMTWTITVVEQIPSSPRKTSLLRWVYSIGTGITIGPIIGFTVGVFVALRAGLTAGGIIGVVSGFVIVLTSGFVDYLTGGTFIKSFSNPVESLQWSWGDIRDKSIFWMTVFLVAGLIARPFRLLGNQASLGLMVSLFLLVGLLVGLLDGLSSAAEIESKTSPNQGIKQSAKISLMTALGGCIFLTLVARLLGLPNSMGAAFGLLIGWYMGGIACLIHCGLRITFCCSQCTPWNYARFLDYAVDHGFLQKVGGGYIFIHRSLMEHFAQSES